MTGRILIIDDEAAIRRLVRGAVGRAGHSVGEAENAAAGLVEARREGCELVLLDLGLPDRDGLELIPLLKAMDRVVVVLTARDATAEKVAALDLGADDYVTKPFDTDELLARLRAALRHRTGSEQSPTIVRRGDLTIDLDRRLVCREGVELHLTRKEHDVLAVLARYIGRVVTHERIIAAAWTGDEDPRVEYLRIVVRNLRQKLEAPGPVGSVIANELGVGYRLRSGD